MPITTPTTEQAQALYRFIQARNEEAWQNALAADDLPEAHFEAIRRIANSHKVAIIGTTSALLVSIDRDEPRQAATLWNRLTSCGQEWQDHPDWRPEWANPERAALLEG